MTVLSSGIAHPLASTCSLGVKDLTSVSFGMLISLWKSSVESEMGRTYEGISDAGGTQTDYSTLILQMYFVVLGSGRRIVVLWMNVTSSTNLAFC